MPQKLIIYPMTLNLKIREYNVHTTEGLVMALLLADNHIAEFTVIAVKES
jgi:hypothetical protein